MRFSYTIQRKLTGQRWLELIPAHWQVRRIKTLFHEVDERNGGGIGELLSLTRAHGLIPQVEASNRIASVSDLSNYKVCRPGNLVMNRMQAWSGMFAVPSTTGLVSPDYCVFETIEECEVRYFEHLFKTRLLVGQFARMSKGIGSGFNRLYTPDFGSISVVCPPLEEQVAIVRYLDQADERINRAIRAKERLIELLAEQRQAIIHRAVTRGLDPNVRLKDSGVEWLGDVPEHWTLRSLKYLSRTIQNGATPPTTEARYYANGTIPWYGPSSCSYQSTVKSPNRYLNQDAVDEGKARLIHGPALLIVVIGATAGRMALLTDDGSTNQQITAYELDDGLVNPFMVLHQLRSAEQWLRSTASTATLPILDSNLVSRMSIALPDLAEQKSIAYHLEAATTDIDASIDNAQRQIDLLNEYRTRLIADVVTGQVDVRDAVVN